MCSQQNNVNTNFFNYNYFFRSQDPATNFSQNDPTSSQRTYRIDRFLAEEARIRRETEKNPNYGIQPTKYPFHAPINGHINAWKAYKESSKINFKVTSKISDEYSLKILQLNPNGVMGKVKEITSLINLVKPDSSYNQG